MNDIICECRDSGYSAKVRISAPGADIIPNWKYISTQSADMNELAEIAFNIRIIK